MLKRFEFKNVRRKRDDMIRKRIVGALLVRLITMLAPVSAWAEQVTEALFQQLAQDDQSVRNCLAKIGPAQL